MPKYKLTPKERAAEQEKEKNLSAYTRAWR